MSFAEDSTNCFQMTPNKLLEPTLDRQAGPLPHPTLPLKGGSTRC